MKSMQFWKLARSLSKVLVASIGLGLISALAFSVFITLANVELQERNIVSIVAQQGEGDRQISVNMRIHKFNVDENSLEISYIVEAPWLQNEVRPKDNRPCLILNVSDRSPETFVAPKNFEFPCEGLPGYANTYGETPRMTIPAYQSVDMFPFDDIVAFTGAHLQPDPAYGDIGVTYKITKLFAGRIVELEGDELNWDLRFKRSFNEKLAILTGALLFISLAIIYGVGIIQQTSSRKVGQEEFIAIAGYVISAAGFREFLRVSNLPSTSLFELVVFVVPLAALCLVIMVSRLLIKPVVAPSS